MMAHRFSRYAVLVAIALLALLVLSAFQPAPVHAAPLQLPLPGWLQDMLDQLEIALVKTLQDTARVGGVLFWGVLKVCGLVGLLDAVITGSVHDLIRGSLMVSLGLFGLSLLAQASLTPPPDAPPPGGHTPGQWHSGTVDRSRGICPGSQSSE